jgi:hypothetical protein
MKLFRAHVLILVFSGAQLGVRAQNNSSPYSILGIGDIEESQFNRTAGMANTGISYRSSNYVIHNNPASYSELQEQLFIVEASARGKFVSYYGNDINGLNNTTRDFSIERLSMGMRINKWWGSSVGIMPFSTANYSFSGRKTIQGSNVYTIADYEGTGGVNQFYWGNGFKLSKHISIGINAAYLSGSLTQKETLAGTSVSDMIVTTKNIYLRNFYPTYGLQYFTKLSKKWDFNFGATYARKQDLQAEYSATVTNGGTTTIKDEITKNDFFTIPNSTGLGISFTRNKKLTLAADYRYQAWSALDYKGFNYSLQNSERLSLGMEISRKQQGWQTVLESMYYQAGLFYDKSYLDIYDQQLRDAGITVGMGFNSKRNALGYHLAFEYGIRGTQNKGLIQEKYGKITVTLSYKDFWLTKGRKYF